MHRSEIAPLNRTGRFRNIVFRAATQAALVAALAVAILPACARAQARPIDPEHSKITVRVGKSGLFSNMVHDHEIEAPISEGSVNAAGALSVELHVDPRRLRVLDPDASEKDRATIQEKMLGPEVLDSNRFREISFVSREVTAKDADHWSVRGELTLHGKARPITVEVARQAGHYTGQTIVKQSDFGMTPVKVGTVKVKDEVGVEFDIQTMP